MEKSFSGKNEINGTYKFIFLALLFVPALLIGLNLDNDVWFLLNTGRYIVQNGFPSVEPFTIHADMAFIVPQWLSTVIFWYVYDLGGVIGLAVLRLAVYSATVIVTYRLCSLVSGNNFFVSFGVSIFMLTLLAMFNVTRPQIFSALIFLLLLYILEAYFIKKNPKYLLFMPLLSILLINLHASMWLMMFVLALPYIVDSFRFKAGFIACAGAKKLPLLLSLAVSAAVGFLNPYGLSAMTYLFRSYGHSEISNSIIEMMPPSINETTGKVVFVVFTLVALIYIVCRRGKSTVRYALLTLGTLVLGLSSLRSFLIFVIAAIFPLAYYLKDYTFMSKTAPEEQAKTLRMRKILTIALVVTLIAAIGVSFMQIDLSESQPEITAAVDYIKSTCDEEKVVLYADYGDGAYTEYEGLKTYIDPRAEVFVIENNKKDDIMLEYYRLQAGTLYYKDFLDKYSFTHLLVREGDALMVNLINDSDYKTVYKDEFCTVFCPVVQK